MIIFGTQDLGPLKYFLALEKWIGEVYWITSKNTQALLKNKKCVSLDSIKEASMIVTGTSLGDSLDKSLIKKSESLNIPTVSIIEHWSWYKKRFELDGEVILPDYIIVNDNYAKDQAINDGLPKKKIFIGGNPHLEELSQSKLSKVILNEWKEHNNIIKNKIILFITESLKNSFLVNTDDYLGYDEYKVLDDIMEVLPDDYTLIIKTHPEEKIEKYMDYNLDCVMILDHMSFSEMVQIPNVIIGMGSMLLIELAMFRDDIISYRPNARKSFIGEKIGATHHADSKDKLKKYIIDNPIAASISFRQKFVGSGKRILKFLDNLI